ncbi:class I SAM-dependent methyltransferase family protein [Candidatus Bathyarchaeota archaeon]|nr:class I SAM-dependent methyltransferase family protein [Candidatus Bathyarchaeota archaeon]
MIHEPLPNQVKEFCKSLVDFETAVQKFAVQTRRPKTALEYAVESLPPHLVSFFPRSIDFVGEIAIVEVPSELNEYRNLVGEAVLKAHKNVRTVLAKSSAVEGVCRLRQYEVIAGQHKTETVHREHGCKFFLDIEKVYFSPRLSQEHFRVASQVKEKETVVDMFAGVGPFSILIAKMRRDVKVYAVDVNPDAVRYLEKNVIANGVIGKVVPIIGDIRKVVKERLRGTADRVIMNLPETAVEYVDVACESLKSEGGVLHYYEFTKGSDALSSAEKHLLEALEGAGRSVHKFSAARIVREVAPFRYQVVIDAVVR